VIALLAGLALAQADVLVDTRTRLIESERAQVIVLASAAAVSIAAGTAIAIAKRDDKFWLNFGVITAAFGAVNMGFAVAGFVQTGNERVSIETKRTLQGDVLLKYRDELVANARSSATIYALNLGLDVAYMTAGALLWVFGQRFLKNDSMHGIGIAGVIQGAMLFVYDLAAWIVSDQHGAAIARLSFAF
jgi:hypothetical protein